MRRLAIIGGDVPALIAAEVFTRMGWSVTVFASGELGGEFLTGGLQHVGETEAMMRFLDSIDIPVSQYNVQGGIHLQGEPFKFPGCLWEMSTSEVKRLHRDYARKIFHAPVEGAMFNDPAAKSKEALRFNFEDFVTELASLVRTRVCEPVEFIDCEHHVVKCGRLFSYDAMVVTIPLWDLKSLANFYVPEVCATNSNFVYVTPRRDEYAAFDYVYTPYTPNDAIHRITPREGGYCAEVSGDLDRVNLHADLQFLFPAGYILGDVSGGQPGHISSNPKPDWPSNHRPLGRYASWDYRASADTVLTEAIKMAEDWTSGCR